MFGTTSEEYECPECGYDMDYSPKDKAMTCQHCGHQQKDRGETLYKKGTEADVSEVNECIGCGNKATSFDGLWCADCLGDEALPDDYQAIREANRGTKETGFKPKERTEQAKRLSISGRIEIYGDEVQISVKDFEADIVEKAFRNLGLDVGTDGEDYGRRDRIKVILRRK